MNVTILQCSFDTKWAGMETVGTESHVHHNQFVHMDVEKLDKVPFFSFMLHSLG